MDFLKRNWANLILLGLSFTGFLLMLIYLFSVGNLHPRFRPDFMGLTQVIAFTVFFCGVMVIMVMKIFGIKKSIRGWTLLGVGIFVTMFMCLATANAANGWNGVDGPFRSIGVDGVNLVPVEDGWLRFVLFPLIVQLFAFGLFPLVWGTKQILGALECDKDTKTEIKKEVKSEKENKEVAGK